MFAMDGDRPGEPQRNLRDAGEVLAVAGGAVRVERVFGRVLQLDAAELLGEALPLADDRLGIIIRRVAWNLDAPLVHLGDRVLDLELQRAERLTLERDLDLVLAEWQRRDPRMHDQRLAQRKGDRMAGRDPIERETGAIAEVERDRLQRHGAAVDADAL